jgi:hypothetical protein
MTISMHEYSAAVRDAKNMDPASSMMAAARAIAAT